MSELKPNMPSLNEHSMKWHNFLIYFALFAGALIDIYNAFQCGTGAIYGTGSVEMVYAQFPGLKPLDIVMVLIYIGMAVLQIVCRFQLAGYRAIGPKMVVLVYILNCVVPILYTVAIASVTRIPFGTLMDGTNWGSYIGPLAAAICTWNYYQKRAELFQN